MRRKCPDEPFTTRESKLEYNNNALATKIQLVPSSPAALLFPGRAPPMNDYNLKKNKIMNDILGVDTKSGQCLAVGL